MTYLYGLALLLLPIEVDASIFGEENVPLYKLVFGQIAELEKLAEALNVAKENRDLLREINDGITRVTDQLNAIEDIVRRAKSLDPASVRSLSDLTRLINDTKSISRDLDSILEARLTLTQEAIEKSALQTETAYLVGQEMISAGARISAESKVASPGRAAQLSASAASAQMMGTGTLLQTIAHLTSIQTIELEMRKGEIEREKRTSDEQKKATNAFLKRRK